MGINMNGLDQVLRNLRAFTPSLKAALALDAQNIAMEMEAYAKQNATWEDNTAHARQFLKATVMWTNTNTLMVALSHQVDYGVYLELCNEGKYAILEKSIAQFAPRFINSWKEICKGVV